MLKTKNVLVFLCESINSDGTVESLLMVEGTVMQTIEKKIAKDVRSAYQSACKLLTGLPLLKRVP